MPLSNSNDPLRTTDHDPSPAAPAQEVAADVTQDAPPVGAETAEYLPGDDTGPTGTEPFGASGLVSIPGYDIFGVLGRGGMGVVYTARHLALKRTVALKMVLAGGHAAPQDLARFRMEAEAVARLQHPNIVQIHEVGETGGHPYCALEFVEGGSLAGKLKGKPLPSREAAKLVEALARAMQLAHSRNVVHRDLKPANVLLAADGTPKITDFGLARQLDSDSGQTQAGQVMGTPSYMAPEQASGRSHDAGPAADVYALGTILYECLTGRPPFKGQTVVETLDQVRTQEPAPPSRGQAGVPLDLETICLKCLRKEPENRYASAAELADDLARFLRHEPVTARPVGSLERIGLWWRRNRALGTLGAAVAVLLVLTTIAAVVAAVQFSELAEQRAKALEDTKTANNNLTIQKNKTTAALAKTKRALGISTQSEALIAWNAGITAMARERLETVDPEARFWDWGYLQRLFAPRSLSPVEPAGVWRVAWSPDGLLLASATGDGFVSVRDAVSGEMRQRIAAHKGMVIGLVYSPDGRHLASAGMDGAMRVWTMPACKLHRELIATTGEFTALAWQPQADWLAIGTQGGTVRLWDAVAGKEGKPLSKPTGAMQPVRVTALAFDPAGRTIARATSDGALSLLSLDGAASHTFPGHNDVSALAFSPDGARLAGGGSIKLQVWEAATGAVVHELPLYAARPQGYTHRVTGLDFRGDGRRLATSCGAYSSAGGAGPGPDTTVRIWDVTAGRLIRTIRSTGGSVHSVRYSPDGQRLAGGGVGGVTVWDVRGDGEFRLFSGSELRVGALAFSPDGARLASVGAADNVFQNRGHLTIWDPASGAVVVSRRHPIQLERVAFAPDGRTLATSNRQGVLEIWDAVSGERLRAVEKAHANKVSALSYQPDGRLASFGQDGWVRLWDLETGKTVAELQRSAEPLRWPTGAVHPGGEYLAIGTHVFNPTSLEDVVMWWPKGDKSVVLDRVKGGTMAMCFSPDGSTLAAISRAGELFTWDTQSRERVLHFKAHAIQARPTSIAFSADGRRLATMAHDRSVRIWDVETGRETLVLTGPTMAGESLRFSPDGKRLAAGGGGMHELAPSSGDVFVWDAAPFSDSSNRLDPAWHAGQLLYNNSLSTLAACFHGRFAVRGHLRPVLAPRVLTAHAEFAKQLQRNGDTRLATAERHLREAIDALAPQLPNDPAARAALIATLVAPRWLEAAPNDAVSEGGAKLTVDRLGFVTVSGTNPKQDVYTLTFPVVTSRITGVQLLMAPYGKGDLGRSANGNFDLSEIELSVLAGGKAPAKKMTLSRAWASYNAPAREHYSKKDMRAEFAIDGDSKTAWNSWPALKTNQYLVVEPSQPAGAIGDSVQVRLLFQGPHDQHTLGQFRLALTNSSQPSLRERWAAELSKRSVSAWTVIAAAAWLDGDPERVIAIRAKAKTAGETALDVALLAWALKQKNAEGAKAAHDRARALAKKQPSDSLLQDVRGK